MIFNLQFYFNCFNCCYLQELQKNYAGLFCDKVENIYKEVYGEQLPSNWLSLLSRLTSNIVIEDLPNQNKSILYYDASPVCIIKKYNLEI